MGWVDAQSSCQAQSFSYVVLTMVEKAPTPVHRESRCQQIQDQDGFFHVFVNLHFNTKRGSRLGDPKRMSLIIQARARHQYQRSTASLHPLVGFVKASWRESGYEPSGRSTTQLYAYAMALAGWSNPTSWKGRRASRPTIPWAMVRQGQPE